RDVRLLLRLELARLSLTATRDDRFDFKGADEDFERAFAEFGLDVLAVNPAEAAERIRSRGIAVELAAFLDTWAWVRRGAWGTKDPAWRELLEVARQADRDERRARVREAVAHQD